MNDFLSSCTPTTIENLAAHAHGRRMLAVCMVLSGQKVPAWGQSFLETTPPDGISEMFTELPRSTMKPLFARGLYPKKWLPALARRLAGLSGTEQQDGMGFWALASPMFTENVLKHVETRATPEARLAIKLNRNCPSGLRNKLPAAAADSQQQDFINMAGLYGDLDGPEVATIVQNERMDMRFAKGVMHLCARTDLTKDLVRKLDGMAEGNAIGVLYANPVHQESVRSGMLYGTSIWTDWAYVSPALTEEQVNSDVSWTHIGKLTPKEEAARRFSTLTHKSASKRALRQAISEPGFEDRMGAFIHSLAGAENPHAAWAIREANELHQLSPGFMGFVKDVTAAELDWAVTTHRKSLGHSVTSKEEADIIEHVSRSNFDWGRGTHRSLNDDFSIKGQIALACCEALYGNPTAQRLQEMTEGDHPFSVVFNPSASGVRLEQLVARDESLRALAALHPNGDKIPVSVTTVGGKEALALRRSLVEFSLPGRGEFHTAQERSDVLHIG